MKRKRKQVEEIEEHDDDDAQYYTNEVGQKPDEGIFFNNRIGINGVFF